ncbi:MAG: cytochrome P450, partial [Sphingomonadaceae bacterium]
MSDGAVDLKSEARAKAYALPLDEFNVADPELFRSETMWPYFERLRNEDPVHYHKEGLHDDGPYWSVTKYNDIMAIDTNHEVFSSEPSITIFDQKEDFTLPMFIAMDPPKHDVQRKTVSPIVSPTNLHMLEPLIRERICATLD